MVVFAFFLFRIVLIDSPEVNTTLMTPVDGFLQEMVSSGVEAAVAAPVSYPVNTTDGEDAGSVSSVDATQLSLALGLVVAA